MDIKTLADFVELARVRSFSQAAAARHVTQPAFSRRVQALETALGTPLVDRAQKHFQLTPAGERFLIHAQNMVALAERATDEVKSLSTHLQKPVFISAPSYLSKTFFPSWYRQMQSAVPGLTMKISNQRGSGAVEDLHKALADFALIMQVEGVSACYSLEGLQSCRVGCDRVLAVRARHARENGNLLMHDQGSYMSACAQALLGKKGVRSAGVFESASTGLIKEMALAGFGMAVLPESLVEDELAQGYLLRVEGIKPRKASILLLRKGSSSHKKADKLWAANLRPS